MDGGWASPGDRVWCRCPIKDKRLEALYSHDGVTFLWCCEWLWFQTPSLPVLPDHTQEWGQRGEAEADGVSHRMFLMRSGGLPRPWWASVSSKEAIMVFTLSDTFRLQLIVVRDSKSAFLHPLPARKDAVSRSQPLLLLPGLASKHPSLFIQT